jgi:chemotaxis protein CheX
MLMDQTVAEVFAAMLGLQCYPSATPDRTLPKISARIEFSGAIQGRCVVAMADADATRLAEVLLAGAADESMVADAVGELCNVLAGSWKRRLRPPASGAGLSVPVIAREDSEAPSDLRQGYDCEGARLAVRLTVLELTEE